MNGIQFTKKIIGGILMRIRKEVIEKAATIEGEEEGIIERNGKEKWRVYVSGNIEKKLERLE